MSEGPRRIPGPAGRQFFWRTLSQLESVTKFLRWHSPHFWRGEDDVPEIVTKVPSYRHVRRNDCASVSHCRHLLKSARFHHSLLYLSNLTMTYDPKDAERWYQRLLLWIILILAVAIDFLSPCGSD